MDSAHHPIVTVSHSYAAVLKGLIKRTRVDIRGYKARYGSVRTRGAFNVSSF